MELKEGTREVSGKISFVLFVFNREKFMKITHLFPMLATENIEKTIKFYTEFLGFMVQGQYPKENPCWVSFCSGNAEIAFHLPNNHPDFEKAVLTGSIYLAVENVDELWEKLKEKVEIVYGLENFEHGMREFGIRDCNGYILNLGQNIE